VTLTLPLRIVGEINIFLTHKDSHQYGAQGHSRLDTVNQNENIRSSDQDPLPSGAAHHETLISRHLSLIDRYFDVRSTQPLLVVI
jgi:hypothetical protein